MTSETTYAPGEHVEFNAESIRGKRYLLASPSVAAINVEAARTLRVAMMTLSNAGALWAGDVSSGRGSVLAARNQAIDGALEALSAGVEVEGVFWIDDDLILPAEALKALAVTGHDFVCGVYCQRAGDMMPLVGRFEEHEGKKGFRWAVDLPENAIMRADGCGFGLVYTSLRMLKALGKGTFNHRDNLSEDLSFCVRAKEAGFPLYCLTGVRAGHLGEPVPVTYEMFRAAWAQNPASKDVETVTVDGAQEANAA